MTVSTVQGSATTNHPYDRSPWVRHVMDDKAKREWFERERGHFEKLFGSIEVLRGKAILDAGCGCGDMTEILAAWAGPEGRVVGIDIGTSNLEIARSRMDSYSGINDNAPVEFRRASYLERVFEDATFDVVIVRSTLCFSGNCRLGFDNLARALKPGGLMYFNLTSFFGQVPVNGKYLVLRLLAGRDFDRIQAWGRRLFRRSIGREAMHRGITLEERLCSPYTSMHGICFHTIGSAFGWMRAHGLDYLASEPPVEYMGYVRPSRRPIYRALATGLNGVLGGAFGRPGAASRFVTQLRWLFFGVVHPLLRNPTGITGLIGIAGRKRGR
jgi:ubiquinone/menaquinone biosynthesis C-methylase UbiE